MVPLYWNALLPSLAGVGWFDRNKPELATRFEKECAPNLPPAIHANYTATSRNKTKGRREITLTISFERMNLISSFDSPNAKQSRYQPDVESWLWNVGNPFVAFESAILKSYDEVSRTEISVSVPITL